MIQKKINTLKHFRPLPNFARTIYIKSFFVIKMYMSLIGLEIMTALVVK